MGDTYDAYDVPHNPWNDNDVNRASYDTQVIPGPRERRSLLTSQPPRNPAFNALLEEIRALHDAKSNDYAAPDDPYTNFRKCEAFGIPAWKGIIVRMSDKFSRLEQLVGGDKEPANESLRDTLIDLAVYSLLCVLVRDEAVRDK